jgi:F-type H+-transporting ATPase subunit delta
MAELATLARPYARAAFEHAAAESVLDGWSASLATAAAVIASERMSALLAEPKKTAAQKADAVIETCGDALSAPAANFIRVMADNKRLLLVPQVYEQFEALKAAQEQSVNVTVTSAFELSDDESARLSEALGRKLNRKINMSSEVDSTLIGGVIVRTEDLVIDGSVRGRLAKLSEAMNS